MNKFWIVFSLFRVCLLFVLEFYFIFSEYTEFKQLFTICLVVLSGISCNFCENPWELRWKELSRLANRWLFADLYCHRRQSHVNSRSPECCWTHSCHVGQWSSKRFVLMGCTDHSERGQHSNVERNTRVPTDCPGTLKWSTAAQSRSITSLHPTFPLDGARVVSSLRNPWSMSQCRRSRR